MSTVLATHQLAIGYKNAGQATATVLDSIDVTLHPGELTCLIGPNGAGKSTLMRTLAGMQAPLAGRVTLGRDELHRLSPAQVAKQLAVVLTERVEVGNLSAYALVALGRHPYTDWRGRLREQDERVVRQALQTVGAAHLAARPLSHLSDGERQKVMIARALAQEPAVLILDEPTAFLDLPRRVEIMQLLHTLALLHAEPTEQQGERTMAALDGQIQVVTDRQVLDHPGGLKLAPDAQAGDAMFRDPHQ
jgi:iron complex transport system ATP-binding protein